MSAEVWVPGAYLLAPVPRTQGVLDLLARVQHPAPRLIADLGCGPGNNTELIARRWPDALVVGVDNSPAMLAAARERERPGHLEFRAADLVEWQPGEPQDVVLINATLQWIPGHAALLPRFAAMLARGGVLGFQMPGGENFPDSLMGIARQLAVEPEWRDRLGDVYFDDDLLAPGEYVAALADAGLRAEAWETHYYYPLPGSGGLAQYASGSMLRPVLGRLAPQEAERFLAEYSRRVGQVLPPRIIGGQPAEMLRLRRVFAIGRA